MVLVVAVGLAVVLTSSVVYFFGRNAQKSSLADTGSAPDGEPTGYIPISTTADPAFVGRFPSRAAEGSPLHLDSGSVWLGSAPASDPDDGILVSAARPAVEGQTPKVLPELMPCTENEVVVVVSRSPVVRAPGNEKVYFNIFADWNRDGTFDGSDECAQEWAVQNLEILPSLSAVSPSAPQSRGAVAVPVRMPTGRQTLQFWMRAVITIGEPVEGPAPQRPYRYGETEDILVGRAASQRSSGKSPAACSGGIPPALAGGSTSLIRAGGGSVSPAPPAGSSAPVAPTGPAPLARLDGITETTLPLSLDQVSGWAVLQSPVLDEIRYGRVRVVESECRFAVVPDSRRRSESQGSSASASPRQEAADGELVGSQGYRSTPMEWGVPATGAAEVGSVGICTDTLAHTGTVTVVPIHRFPARELAARQAASESSVVVTREDGLPTSAATETTPSQQPSVSETAPRHVGLQALRDGSGALRAVAFEAEPDAGGTRLSMTFGTSSNDGSSSICTVEFGGPLPELPAESPGEVAGGNTGGSHGIPSSGATPRIAGDYDVVFSKKSDSCGVFELKTSEVIRVRQYGERIEVQRRGGNLSSGQVLPDGGFRATGSGQTKDGKPYIESYVGKATPEGISGTYDLQQDACRASFEIEGTRR